MKTLDNNYPRMTTGCSSAVRVEKWMSIFPRGQIGMVLALLLDRALADVAATFFTGWVLVLDNIAMLFGLIIVICNDIVCAC